MTTERKNTGTREWATHTANIDLGCANGCIYCFARTSAARFKKMPAGEWCEPIPKAKFPHLTRVPGTLMFPSAHDITEQNVDRCIEFLNIAFGKGKKILIVSKPREKVIAKLVEGIAQHKDKTLFRFTIGSPRDSVLKYWEPNASTFGERVACLGECFSKGWKTSVSSEPMLDSPDNMTKLIGITGPFVTDAIWMGLMNKSAYRLKLNGFPDAVSEAAKILSMWNNDEVMKFYQLYKDHPIVKWKDSIKAIVGLPPNEEAGEDR